MHFKKEKYRYFDWYKKLVCAGPKSAGNILTNLSPHLAWLTTLDGRVKLSCFKARVPNQGCTYPQWYICTYQAAPKVWQNQYDKEKSCRSRLVMYRGINRRPSLLPKCRKPILLKN